MNPHLVEFHMLAKWEIPYSEVEHLLALPVDVRKMELLRILITTTIANRELHDFQLNDFLKAMGEHHWEQVKGQSVHNKTIDDVDGLECLLHQRH